MARTIAEWIAAAMARKYSEVKIDATPEVRNGEPGFLLWITSDEIEDLGLSVTQFATFDDVFSYWWNNMGSWENEEMWVAKLESEVQKAKKRLNDAFQENDQEEARDE